jgi:DNA-binding CsgD family transcriptional regulator
MQAENTQLSFPSSLDESQVHFLETYLQLTNQMKVENSNELAQSLSNHQNSNIFSDSSANFFMESNGLKPSFVEQNYPYSPYSALSNLLCFHLLQADQKVGLIAQFLHLLTQLIDAAEQTNTIILNAEGKVTLMTQCAWALLKKYFPLSSQQNCLTKSLQQWVNHQIAAHTSSLNPQLFTPLQIEGEEEGRHLIIRFVSDASTEHYVLLLEERSLCKFSLEAIAALGLTKREAEVLFWITQGQDNTEVALTLYISQRTVKKHLEHIYKKLGVSSRAAAIAHAVGALGILT